MKKLFIFLVILGLPTACQQSKKPAIGTPTTDVTPRTQYRLVFIKQEQMRLDEKYLKDVETAVNQAIAEGWQPVGGVTLFASAPVQAMMKTE